ncbi:hypothetical protein DCS_01464 [Drechmeria coniospora]|uniref:Uncharacterized protein n=1 Tax=Drechmeria coniospora TaxID=98403 RepID=A0A151GTA1_DRECN|nr:hypothetical protein DCS_01464 [Drechmeria coniospora]KYK60327.1 hypothetical protein DCS_01464 [Drechmeria coniospora]
MEHDKTLRQPDFSTAAGGLRLAVEHLELYGNLPAADSGTCLQEKTVLQQLTTLNRGMRDLNRKVDGLDQKVDGLDRKITILNQNALVRAQNSTVERGNTPLVPLYSILTGNLLEGFPPNMEQLERLPSECGSSS